MILRACGSHLPVWSGRAASGLGSLLKATNPFDQPGVT